MFCSFEGAPNIMRIYGQGHIVLPGTMQWTELTPRFPNLPGIRQIFDVEVHGVQDSCGFGIPRMVYQDEREDLTNWAAKMGPDKLANYRKEKNAFSIDGLPAPLREG
jgi:hypothetical protein